ncbi:HAD-IIIC family phosphatase [Aciditerrimonas ferrireducens]|uniref:HAD-IIIC family phosphatase n=1 Tax=Aciditerrimonas ferrireducens TaxID=667306 RepID=UPI00200585EB|nr:HAD-IIIC family phosphatase [Aciditerrimonas ferrireducens]MCK4178056.1 HAD-IIIC family phosphatase [Aciditerrimonas ferrireducens]
MLGRLPLRSRWPHLRIQPLLPADQLNAALEQLPAHVRPIVRNPTSSPTASVILASPLLAHITLPEGLPVVTAEDIDAAYQRWMHEHYLPMHRSVLSHFPDSLVPPRPEPEHLRVEIVGSCVAESFAASIPWIAAQVDIAAEVNLVTHNHPVPVCRSHPDPDLQIVIPPFRYMHPGRTTNFFWWERSEDRFLECAEHMNSYLDEVAKGLPARYRFVTNFLEPLFNPLGSEIEDDSLGNFKVFVARLNERLASWCASHENTFMVDADALAASVGHFHTDDGISAFFSHRGVLTPNDDPILQIRGIENPYPMAASFAVNPLAWYAALFCHVLQRRTTLLATDPVKLVITDLDGTLWRGVIAEHTPDQDFGLWEAEPFAYAEALQILRRRGILLAIASKNDEAFVRAHWDEFKSRGSDPVALESDLSLDDFVMAKISFRPKSESVREILAATNISAANTVFIDDNPLEREEVQAAFPEIRTLGAEMHYLRRELLWSPYTQRSSLTKEDAERTALTRRRISFHQVSSSADGGAGYLATLRLELRAGAVADPGTPEVERCLQLINKTNQWTINGRRLDRPTLERRLAAGQLALFGEVRDIHGSHGIVVAGLLDPAERILTHLVVSCRVIGMGIDEAFAATLCDVFGELRVEAEATERNSAAQAFLARHAPDGILASVPCPSHVTVIDVGLPDRSRQAAAAAPPPALPVG